MHKKQQGSIWIMLSVVLILVAAIALVLSPMATNIQDFASSFGWKSTKQLKKDLKESEFAINAAVKSNEDLNKKVEDQSKSNEASVLAVDQKHTVETTIEKKVETIKLQQKVKSEGVKVKYKDIPKTPAVDKVIDQETAETQIASIWQTYCTFNSHTECQANTA